MFKSFFRSVPAGGRLPLLCTDLASLALRLCLAGIFLAHGLHKILDAGNNWGSNWVSGVVGLEDRTAPNTPFFTAEQLIIAWGETLGGAALALGLLSRLAALGEILIQIGAVYIASVWSDFSLTKGGGPEYNFALLAMCLAVLMLGSGRCSLDYLFQRAPAAPPAPATPEPTPETLAAATNR